ncbi:energy-converting hydrogenase Eha subunit B [Neisseria sp. HSC-16F19]|nr:hypothetical protein [Neisseria sp. HSC-16F19]MCP2040937.1 energy-converting hydrogenase Eha subunit B [Neisseria sp. HSC-16F19]
MGWVLILSFLCGLAAGGLCRSARAWYIGIGVPMLCVAALIVYLGMLMPADGGFAALWPDWPTLGVPAAYGGAMGVWLTRLLRR